MARLIRRSNLDGRAAFLVVATTAFSGGVSLLVLALQHRLVTQPLGADGPDQVVANDIILAMILRDLVLAVVVAVLFSSIAVLGWLQEPLLVMVPAILLIMFAITRVLNPALGPNLTPVATALAGSSRSEGARPAANR